MVKSCLLIGGDNRHRIMADMLTKKGITVYCYGMDGCVNLTNKAQIVQKIPPTDLVVFPIPITKDGKTINSHYATREITLDRVLSELHADTLVCGGLFPAHFTAELERKKIPYYDYGKSDKFAWLNAVPSAEGAIEIALRNTPFILDGAKVCVVGFGKIGKSLVKKLMGLGCQVTATARKPSDLYTIAMTGAAELRTDQLSVAESFDVIFNTVPAPVISKEVLDRQTPSTLIIDLASKPGGVDFNYAESQGIHCIHALSLPARCAPDTAASIILSVIEQFLIEMK